MPMPAKANKAQLQERIKELEEIVDKQDAEWNDLVKNYDDLKASKGADNDVDITESAEYKALLQQKENAERQLKEMSDKFEEQNRLNKGYKSQLQKEQAGCEKLKEEIKQLKKANNKELSSINEQLIIDKKQLIEEVSDLKQRNKELSMNDNRQTLVTDNNNMFTITPDDMEESIEKLVVKLTRNGKAVHTNVGNRTFLTMNDAKEYANLKHDDSIRSMLKGVAKSAGYVMIEGERVPIKDWTEATNEQVEQRKQEVISAIMYKVLNNK